MLITLKKLKIATITTTQNNTEKFIGTYRYYSTNITHQHWWKSKLRMIMQWNLYNLTPEFSDILWHLIKIYGPKVFLLIKIKPEYFDILYNPTHFPGPFVCQIRQVLTSFTIQHISLVPLCVGLDRFWNPLQSNTFPWSLCVSD